MELERVRPWQVLVLAGLARAALICWAEYQDTHLTVKYTDIDYVVFTDAARYVATGASPYQRATYRYSPLLAFLLVPNVRLHPAWGKVLFSASDLAVAGLLQYILVRTGTTRPLRTAALLLWLFNPYTATISTRGSCDVLSVLLLLSLLVTLLHGWSAASGALYGLAVHFRIYPVIYGPSIALYLMRRGVARLRTGGGAGAVPAAGGASSAAGARQPATEAVGISSRDAVQSSPGMPSPLTANRRRRGRPSRGTAERQTADAGEGEGQSTSGVPPPDVGVGLLRRPTAAQTATAALAPAVLFGAAAAASFLALGAVFYRLYGREFLQEAFLHHLTRKDPRHNFSPYYYPVYLSYGSTDTTNSSRSAATAAGGRAGVASAGLLQAAWAAVRRAVPMDEPWRLALLPQAAALLALAVTFHEDLPAAWMLQTWAFVALNKVVTAQYFVWYLSLVPLVLPALAAQRAVSAGALAAGAAAWVAAQLHWLAWAYQLEMKGRSVHLGLWAASLAFLAANTALLVLLTRALRWHLRRRRHRELAGGGGREPVEGSGGGAAKQAGCRDASRGANCVTFLEASLRMARPWRADAAGQKRQ